MRSQVISIFGTLLLLLMINTITMKRTCKAKFEQADEEFINDPNSGLSSAEKWGITRGKKVLKKCRFMIGKLTKKCLKSQGACKSFPRAAKKGSLIEAECNPIAPVCNDNTMKFRTYDGSCNNLQNPTWGMANKIYNRILENAYDNGRDTARTKSVCKGGKLPSARQVSNIVHDAKTPPLFDDIRASFITVFGQFLAHDVALTPMFTDGNGDPLDCCAKGKKRPECFSIRILPNDPAYGQRKCMSFARSEARLDCRGIRQQLNLHTAYLDASHIYGISEEENLSLRAGHGGEFKVEDNKRLPVDVSDALCERPKTCRPSQCFCTMSGDTRVNENPALAGFHTLFHRNHNLLAKGLSKQNPTWEDEELFQAARKINTASWQHIIYKEYLVATIGRSIMEQYNINVKDLGHKHTYDARTDATIFNGFTTAVYRFGHAIVSKSLFLKDFDFNLIRTEELKNHFFNPELYHRLNGTGLEYLLMGLADSRCPLMDRKVEDSTRVNLFPDNRNHSLDLAALNIQRGRDHGIPTYNEWRTFCRLPRAGNFTAGSGLADHSADAAAVLEQAYTCTDDIDAWTGMISEASASGSQLGRTSQCLMATQFKRLRDGDRFFYENLDPVGFTNEQLAEIKKIRMSTLVCLNTGAKHIQENVFFRSDPSTNHKIDCSTVKGVDFSKWKIVRGKKVQKG